MTEYEKMISGRLYDARDPELVRMRRRVRTLLGQLNRSLQDVRSGRRLGICREIFGKMGSGLWLQPPFYCDYGKNITLGENVYFNFNCTILDVAPVTIGSFVMFGPQVQIYTAGHPLDWRERKEGREYGKPVSIGDHVWVGGHAVFCPGVSVGNGSVVAAGAVVTKDVPSHVLVAGSPARIIRKIREIRDCP
ncbi:MAG: sugar O-acetyltransferase [Elusimicrobia bacterium]|nr:sugar O-acetyltransferase [Elusimicrobiota bacterium]